MEPIRYCENSTIVEAWVLVLGRAAPADANEVAALVHTAKRRFSNLTQLPSLVMVEGSQEGVLPPHWQHQLSWDDGAKLARVGHQYLSVHFLRRPAGPKYETFDRSLLPDLSAWLELARTVYARDRELYPADAAVFGYVNAFDFSEPQFDLSRYFKANIGLGVEIAQAGLRGLDATFRMGAGAGHQVSLSLKVEPSDDKVSVTTKTVAQEIASGLTVFDRDALNAKILAAKERAKAVFFDFATTETHTLMGARS